MLRTLALASVASLFALTVGCSGSPDASPDDSTDDALSASLSGFYTSTGPGVTGGIAVRLANAKTTKCVDGSKQSLCEILTVDYSKLGLSDSDAKALDAAFQAGHAVVKGKLAGDNAYGSSKQGIAPMLVADKAWMGATTDGAQDLDQLYLVNIHIQNAMCIPNSGCGGLQYNQVEVNVSGKTTTTLVNDVALDGVGSASKVATAQDQMKIGGDGLLVLGHDIALVSNHNAETTRTLMPTNYFLPVTSTDPGPTDCRTLTCAQGMHCEMKGLNGGAAVPVCINN